jgi:hypothetical protein
LHGVRLPRFVRDSSPVIHEPDEPNVALRAVGRDTPRRRDGKGLENVDVFARADHTRHIIEQSV